MTCGELADVAAELALGALTGRERALALAHLEGCEPCREAIRRLMTTADQLPGLLPARDPSPGFEAAVMEWIDLIPPSRVQERGSRKARLGCLLAAAGVLVAVSAGAAGWGARHTAPPAVYPLASAVLAAPGHHMVGRAFAYRAAPGWIFVWVNLGSGRRAVTCQLVGPGGQVATVGTFWLAGGRGSWGGPVTVVPGWPAAIQLVAASGTILAIARFPRP